MKICPGLCLACQLATFDLQSMLTQTVAILLQMLCDFWPPKLTVNGSLLMRLQCRRDRHIEFNDSPQLLRFTKYPIAPIVSPMGQWKLASCNSIIKKWNIFRLLKHYRFISMSFEYLLSWLLISWTLDCILRGHESNCQQPFSVKDQRLSRRSAGCIMLSSVL